MNPIDGTFFKFIDASQVGTWPVRIAWFALPIVFRAGFIPATSGLNDTGTVGLEVLAWLTWFVGLLAVAVHHPTALTTIRILAPVPPLALLLAAILTNQLPLSILLVIAYCLAIVAAVFLPAFGDPMVNGSAYGPERRVALRPPGYVALVAVPVIWLLMFGFIASGVTLAASGMTLFGVPLIFVGSAISYAGFQSLNQLSRRWLVFVPAGFVLHDRVLLTEPVLIPRKVINNLGLVERIDDVEIWKRKDGTVETVDASGGAPGYVLEVDTSADIPITLRGRGDIREVMSRNIQFTPTLPGKVLTEARIRGIRVGAVKPTEPEPEKSALTESGNED